MFDRFSIFSGKLYFTHTPEDQDWLLDEAPTVDLEEESELGTLVQMLISVPSDRGMKDVLDRYTLNEDDYGFSKTIVPVTLARYGEENLVSRSQARRMLTRIERFQEVILDFTNVNIIGQAFADEIFRVWRNAHPEVKLTPLNTNQEVSRAIMRALMGS